MPVAARVRPVDHSTSETLEFFGTYKRMPWGLVEQIVRALDGFAFDVEVLLLAQARLPGPISQRR